MKLQPFDNGVFFQFLEDTTNTKFANKSAGGLFISLDSTVQANVPRWGKVTHVGPKVRDVTLGEYILIEAGMWTQSFEVHEGHKLWKTDEEKVLLATFDRPTVGL